MAYSNEAALCAAVSQMASLQTRIRHVQGGLVKPVSLLGRPGTGPGRSRREERSQSPLQIPWSLRPVPR
eukprot:9155168-Heterocapsa_arctica.AAC.1